MGEPIHTMFKAPQLGSVTRLIGMLACGACAAPRAPVTSTAMTHAPVSAPSGASAPTRPAYESRGGMWLPSQIPEHAAELKQLGLQIDPALLADPKSSLLGAIVNMGCSASFVSNDGLLITNHHCATGALQANSTPTADLLAQGMLAKTRAEERSSGPSARLNVLSKMSDVTARVRAALDQAADDRARELELERLQKELVSSCENGHAGTRCALLSMYGGAGYFLSETLELRDIRIVYAPAAGIGNFGGEVDNWRWPRHSGDVAFFRAYVGKDGKPADYSLANVPYHPPAVLKIAQTPLAEGDLVFVAGYPAETSMLAPAVELRQTVNVWYPEQLAMFDAYLSLIAELSEGDPALAIKATSRRRGFDNYRTKRLGELEGIQREGLLAEKEATDKALQAFINADPTRLMKYGTVIGDLERAYAERELTREADTALEREILMPRLMFAAYRVLRMADERQKPDAERDPDYQERNVPKLVDELKSLNASYDPKLDRAYLKLALQRDRARDMQHRTAALEAIAGKNPTDQAIDAAIAALWEKTQLGDEKFRLSVFKNASFKELASHPDPMLRLAAKLYPQFQALIERRKRFQGALLRLEPPYVEALIAFKGGAVAPDANRTLRVAYGTVKRAPAGEPSSPLGAFTTVSQVVAKNTGKPPFQVPPLLLAAAKDAPHSPFADRALGDVPVDFLSDLQITNGNSGSATLNARGELVGLAFDGTYQSVASDWAFKPNTRSIHVDLRYILFLLKSVDHADALLSELGVNR